ncbi:MAG: hypothetical protein MPJ81_00825 [Gammaproteobacteria bacterium]|nr:hypothetical protein [Gammaproteobacteria bacterium]MDA8011330.1 hypothetical protein [Gammaproteobacteria bacterium]
MQIPLRPPSQVMRLARMGCFHQTRLSFMRALLRDLKRERWKFARESWRVDARGEGVALYSARGPRRTYTLVCFSRDLPAKLRSDRVIANAWDATFALFDGAPDEADIKRLAANVPLQEAGQCRQSELVMSRANRSVRVFSRVVDALARGAQPPRELLDASGYLMRTTAVYANGKFGLCDRENFAGRAGHDQMFAAPFRAEMLAVWLIRWFSIDLAEHLARAAGGRKAVKLARPLARQLGIGNATGLGMAPFLLLHPALLHCWMRARETALSRVRGISQSSKKTRAHFCRALARMRAGLSQWRTEDRRQLGRLRELKNDLEKIAAQTRGGALQGEAPWDALIRWSRRALSMEGQELLVSLALEPHGELVDDLAHEMSVDESRYWRIRADRRVGELRGAIDANYRWALGADYAEPRRCARFWYVSEEKLEPRLGERFEEPGAEKELPLAAARDIAALRASLGAFDADATLAEFLRAHPRHRHAVRRAQLAAQLPYAEIRDNVIAKELRPVDLLRCKLSFFGATRFDPKSDRWVRITMYQHAPFPDELSAMDADDWAYPPLGEDAE